MLFYKKCKAINFSCPKRVKAVKSFYKLCKAINFSCPKRVKGIYYHIATPLSHPPGIYAILVDSSRVVLLE